MRTSDSLDQPRDKGLLHFKSRRLHTMLLLMAGTACMTLLTTNIGITLACMVNSTAIAREAATENNFSVSLRNVDAEHAKCHADSFTYVVDYGGEFNWPEMTQSVIRFAAFIGGAVFMFPGGYASDHFSVKRVLLVSMTVMSIANLLFPLASKISFDIGRLPILAIILRFFMGAGEGLYLPAQNALMVRWIPLKEKATAGAIYSIGYQIGGVVGVPLAAAFCQSVFRWPSVFYASALFGFVWIVAFYALAADEPEAASYISLAEKNHLRQELQHLRKKNEKLSFPFLAAAKSPAVWVVIYAVLAGNFVITFIQLYIPTFFKDVLYLNVKKNGLLTAFPHLAQAICKFTYSSLLDRAKRRGLSPTAGVRISQGISCIGLVTGFLCMAYFVSCETVWLAICLSCLITCSFGISIAGFITSMLSIAPAHVGMLTSITNTIGYGGRFLCPLIVQHFKTIGTGAEWSRIFTAFSVIPFLSLISFSFFASGVVEPWAQINPPQSSETTEMLSSPKSSSKSPETS